ncbi:MAG: hypothetical protein KatS3mg087_1125 [Patescibacteria group bacterium]|nr:MAG: hypothetical protein KatS3mg087_1125 [Patescibacteria group bacterium]
MAKLIGSGYVYVRDVARIFGLSRARILQLVRVGRLHGVKVEGRNRWLIDVRSLAAIRRQQGKMDKGLLARLQKGLHKLESNDGILVRELLGKTQIEWVDKQLDEIFKRHNINPKVKEELKGYAETLYALGAKPSELVDLVVEWVKKNIVENDDLYNFLRWVPVVVQLILLLPAFAEEKKEYSDAEGNESRALFYKVKA